MNLAERLSNSVGWIYLLIFIALGVIVFYTAKSIIAWYNEGDKNEKKRQKTRSTIFGLGLIVYVFFFFLNFGNKEQPSQIQSAEETQEYKRLQEKDAEMTQEQIDKDAIEQTTKELRIQSDDSLRKKYLEDSEKKSDEVIEKYLND
ncbi:MAG: hypothetical protein AABY15_02035 [Nanoarchaeota archaeon]